MSWGVISGVKEFMGIDVLTVGVGFVSFGIFLLIHWLTFRWISPEQLLKSLTMTVIAIAGLPALLMAVLFTWKWAEASLQAWVCAGALAMAVNGLLCFVYVLCVFGPYETSVRMRLVREIARAGAKGISRQELLKRYNAQTIVDLRLRRLMGSGDIIEKDGRYRVARKKNLFFIFDAIAGGIKKWIGR